MSGFQLGTHVHIGLRFESDSVSWGKEGMKDERRAEKEVQGEVT